MKRKVETLTLKQLSKILERLDKNYPSLLKGIGFKDGYPEQICGDISNAITTFIKDELGVPARFMSGMYKGRGTIFSGGRHGTSHCWVELKVRMKEAWKTPLVRIIIDGAYAQFYPDFTPKVIKDRVRLAIFLNDKTALRWYKPDASYRRRAK